MKQIRYGLFETNSSSTHSVSIHVKKELEVINDIPRNSQSVFIIPEYECADGDEETETISNLLMSEVYKTSFILNIIAKYIDKIYDEMSEEDFDNTFSDLCGGITTDLDEPDEVKSSIAEDLIYTKWLKELVYEETGTRIKFDVSKETYKYFPYISVPYPERTSGDEFFGDIYSSIEESNEYKFKSLCKEIIFNKDIVILDEDEAYSCTFSRNLK